ncbi:hypothetical protein [Massilia sp. BJB1822]|uniref:hypothetical protein n=1 Tax=Massilia sp. BJB1822 TaxID=2744470 RepID=UPI0015939540|nr:hypothetical protein [Massilia sp. BJB1822]NVD97662.1 hypothetical protein [Massilia sp. BJB1822]
MLNREMIIQQFTVLDSKRRRYQMMLVRSWTDTPVQANTVRRSTGSLRYALTTGEPAMQLSEHTFEVIQPDQEDGLIVHRLR